MKSWHDLNIWPAIGLTIVMIVIKLFWWPAMPWIIAFFFIWIFPLALFWWIAFILLIGAAVYLIHWFLSSMSYILGLKS